MKVYYLGYLRTGYVCIQNATKKKTKKGLMVCVNGIRDIFAACGMPG